MARIIELSIDNEWIKGSGVFAGATGSFNDVILRITFSEDWDEYGKIVEFLDANHENAVIVPVGLPVEGTARTFDVPIPAAAKAVPGKMAVTVKGTVTEGSVKTKETLTSYGEFQIAESLWTDEASEQEEIEATVAEQLQAEVAAIHSAVINMTVSAETLEPTEEVTVEKTYSGGKYNLHFGIPRGTSGISIQAGGRYGFYVDENGHLRVVYEDDVEYPKFRIENGHLIMTLED